MSQDSAAALLERVVVGGDLSRLSPTDRMLYYRQVCESVGLNPLTRPFDYLTLSGRMVLYAKRDATDQLRAIHGVSITKLERDKYDDLYVVTAYATDKTGRTDSSTGAVSTAGLRGDALANAIMKAETKAKRRVTLSLCGLGLLDETEVASVPDAKPVIVNMETGEILGAAPTIPAIAKSPEQLFETPGEQEAREQTEAEARTALLGLVKGAADHLTLTAKDRAALWAQHCGRATPANVDVAALQALYDALQAKAQAKAEATTAGRT
jgi:hypothetical protein